MKTLAWMMVGLIQSNGPLIQKALADWGEHTFARLENGAECWYVVSDQLTGVETFDDYGRRFNIEENFLAQPVATSCSKDVTLCSGKF